MFLQSDAIHGHYIASVSTVKLFIMPGNNKVKRAASQRLNRPAKKAKKAKKVKKAKKSDRISIPISDIKYLCKRLTVHVRRHPMIVNPLPTVSDICIVFLDEIFLGFFNISCR